MNIVFINIIQQDAKINIMDIKSIIILKILMKIFLFSVALKIVDQFYILFIMEI